MLSTQAVISWLKMAWAGTTWPLHPYQNMAIGLLKMRFRPFQSRSSVCPSSFQERVDRQPCPPPPLLGAILAGPGIQLCNQFIIHIDINESHLHNSCCSLYNYSKLLKSLTSLATPGAGGDSQGASKEWSRWDLLLVCADLMRGDDGTRILLTEFRRQRRQQRQRQHHRQEQPFLRRVVCLAR